MSDVSFIAAAAQHHAPGMLAILCMMIVLVAFVAGLVAVAKAAEAGAF